LLTCYARGRVSADDWNRSKLTTMLTDNLIHRQIFDARTLREDYPPRYHHQNKKVVDRIATPLGSHHSGEIVFSRWRSISLAETNELAADYPTEVIVKEGYFTYKGDVDRQPLDSIVWHVNFADKQLFFGYAGGLFAQDEMQVAEHPALASLREALLAQKIPPVTVEAGKPTPVIVKGVERRCQIATDPNPDRERPFGLYGNHFARASSKAIELATQPLQPPSIVNIIAMEAPPGGFGIYTTETISYILETAITGFAAAKVESRSSSGENPCITVNTGFWGCGAFGGNRVLMLLLQMLAARCVGVDRLVFYLGSDGFPQWETAREIFEDLLRSSGRSLLVRSAISELVSLGFAWGVSDGN
jgi:hypothetical protein